MRRSRREPTYFYQSASASIEGKVRFSEGCVVLPHARICVPPGFLLEVGPFNLFADFSELHISASHPDGIAPTVQTTPATVATLRISSHNHFQSYACVCFDVQLPTTAAAPEGVSKDSVIPSPAMPRRIELLGSGNVFQSFASVRVRMCGQHVTQKDVTSEECRFTSHPWQLGNFNVFATHAHVALASTDEHGGVRDRDETQREGSGREGRTALFFSPAPVMPALDSIEGLQTAEPSMPGRTFVEERLFQDHSSDDDEEMTKTGSKETAKPSPSPFPAATATTVAARACDDTSCSTVVGNARMAPPPSRIITKSQQTANEEAASSPVDAASENAAVAAARVSNVIYFSHNDNAGSDLHAGVTDSWAERHNSTIALPRYGIRSVSELPTIIKRIIDEEKQKRAHDELQQQPVSSSLPSAASAVSLEPSSLLGAAAAAAALSNLADYVDSVHPDLRAHTENGILVAVERVCHFYIRQYIEEADLYPVDSQYDED